MGCDIWAEVMCTPLSHLTLKNLLCTVFFDLCSFLIPRVEINLGRLEELHTEDDEISMDSTWLCELPLEGSHLINNYKTGPCHELDLTLSD